MKIVTFGWQNYRQYFFQTISKWFHSFFFKERKKSTGENSRVISKGENYTSITYKTKMEKKCMKSEKQIYFIHPHTGGNKQTSAMWWEGIVLF